MQGLFTESLDGIELLLVLGLLVVNLVTDLHLGVLSLLLDESNLVPVELVLIRNGITNYLLHKFELIWDAQNSVLGLFSHEEDHVAALSESVLTPNLDVFLSELRSEHVDVVDGLLGNFSISLGNDSDQEIHENDQKKDDVGEIEDCPNGSNHEFGEEPVVTSFDLGFPEEVLWSGDISDGVSGGLHDIDQEIKLDTTVISVIESSSDESIECSNEENPDHEEGEETRDILNTGTKKSNHVTNGWVHSQNSEYLQRR